MGGRRPSQINLRSRRIVSGRGTLTGNDLVGLLQISTASLQLLHMQRVLFLVDLPKIKRRLMS